MWKRIILAAILALVLAKPAFGATAETFVPPSPEPPAAKIMTRPTPAPTPVPTETIIDHVHRPDLYPEFAFRKEKKLLEIWFPNIRDADAAILLYDGDVYMIDCGDERAAERSVQLIRQLGISRIDILFNSHMHHDHIDGLRMTYEAARIGKIKICFPPDLTASGLNMIATAAELGIPVTEYRDGDTFTMGDGAVTLLFLKNNEEEMDINNQSAQTMVAYGERRILFTADMEKSGQRAMVNRVEPGTLKCDILKYPHHGKTGLHDPFYEATGARLAVMTSYEGRKDPGQTDMSNRRIPVVFTSVKDLFTHLVTDGEYWLVEQVAATAH